MKRIYLASLITLCFMFVAPSQAISSTFFKVKDIKLKIKNCELDNTTLFANKIEFKIKKKTHSYKIFGGNITQDYYPFSFDALTIEEFHETDLNAILTAIFTNINKGVVKGYGKDKMGFEYEWKAVKHNTISNTYNIEIEIES